MGLFNRHESNASPDEEGLDLPTRDDFHQPLVDEPRAPKRSRYGIDDAMALMRQLPDTPDEQTMEVICKTLESAQIRTADLLQDAEQKEQRIQRQHQSIEQDISQLQQQIESKQSQLAELSANLEELARIRRRFESARASRSVAEPDPITPPEATLDEGPEGDESALTEPATPITAGRRQRGPVR